MTTPHESARLILDEVERAVVGKRDRVELVLLGLLAGGHVLLEDRPGTGKTLLARSLARAVDLTFSRVQFTPDLLPSDITGAATYDPRTHEFRHLPGPVFTNVLLGDEINRAPPKTQAALLEAMAERQVTTDGTTRALPDPFVVIATQNPLDVEGTYPLPEAQLDRFLLKLELGYPDDEDEWEVLRRRIDRRQDEVAIRVVADADTIATMRTAVEDVHVDEDVGRYAVALTRGTRDARGVRVGASPRGALALLATSRARALVHGRDHVLPDDVKELAVPCLAHRLVLDTELWVRGVAPEQVVRDVLAAVPAPPTRP